MLKIPARSVEPADDREQDVEQGQDLEHGAKASVGLTAWVPKALIAALRTTGSDEGYSYVRDWCKQGERDKGVGNAY